MSLRTNRSEVKSYFQDWLDTAFRNELIDRHKREGALRAMETHLSRVVVGLNRLGKVRLDLGGRNLNIFLREGREVHFGDPTMGTGRFAFSTFNLFEMQWSRTEHPTKLVCFVGYRYHPAISDSLIMNLRYVLEPSNVELVRSEKDMAAVGFFDDIVDKIQKCDFCIFDNRLTERKPNVYIEAGIAYILDKPFIFANHRASKLQIPSDLRHIRSIDYRSYEDLTRKLHFNLSVFLRDVRSRKPPAVGPEIAQT